MFTGAKNTKQQANVGLGAAIAYYCSQCCTVSIPLNDSQDYDLVVDRGGELMKVQVKTSRRERYGGYTVLLSMQGGSRAAGVHKKHTSCVYDTLFVVTRDGTRYEIPREKIAHISREILVPGRYAEFRI